MCDIASTLVADLLKAVASEEGVDTNAIAVEALEFVGHEDVVVVKEDLMVPTHDGGGERDGERVGNATSGLVAEVEGERDVRATLWLESLFKYAQDHSTDPSAVGEKLESSRMLRPIVVNAEGETLVESGDPRHPSVYSSHTSDDDSITRMLVHKYCRGWIDMFQVSKTHRALRCRQCSLRVVFPIEIQTLGELREHFLRTL